MVAMFLAPASFAGQPGFAGEKLNYVGDGDLGVDYTAEFAAASVPGQPASVVLEKLNYVGDGDLGVDYTAAEFQHSVPVEKLDSGLGRSPAELDRGGVPKEGIARQALVSD